jgi:hypothetical protein
MKVIKYDGFKNALKEGIKLGVFITVILMAILDAFSGPVVAMRIREVRSVWPIEDEIVYNVAHWHLLALTFGIIMFMLYLELSLKGFSRSLISWLTVGGFALVIIGGFFYMLSPMFVGTPVHEIAIRSLEIKNNVLPIIEIGATLLLISLLFTFFKLLKIK